MFSSTPCSIFRPGAGRPLPSCSVIGPQCPCCPQWGCGLGKGLLTSVIESRGSAHPPLSLIHSGSAGAAHLHADIGHLLRLQGPHHHHVHVAKLVSTDILQANSWGPRLRPWD